MRKHKSGKIILVLLSLSGFLFLAGQTSWAKYPEKPITAIMCWSAGGVIDLSFRPLATSASKTLGQQIIIETHPGGSGGVGMGFLKSRRADGYTIGVTTISTLIHQNLNKVSFDLLKDFVPIMQYSYGPFVIVSLPTAPWKTFKEFLEYAKANPGKVRIGSSGPADPGGFLTMSSLANLLKIDWTHVPFEGGMPALAAVLGGHVEAYTGTLGMSASNIKAGKLRLLATFGEKRLAKFPDVPTLTEMGIPIVAPSFAAIFARKEITPEIQETLHQTFKKGMEDPEFQKGLEITYRGFSYKGPKEAAAYYQEVDQEIQKIMREQKLKQK